MVGKKWDRIILREICDSVNYGYTASANSDPIGPKFLRITDIVPNRIDWSSVPHCEISEENLGKYLLEKNDIVIARTGATTGYAKRIRTEHKAVFASYLVQIRVNPNCDSQYVGFVVESEEYKRFIQLNLGGAAQPQANAQVLTSFPIPLPPLSTQRKIAAILSTYDNLIENNTRRIKILEDMAQTLYREWFVHFRFPGHENVPMVESPLGAIPQGWEVKKVKEIVKRLTAGKTYRETDVNEAGSIIVIDQSRADSLGFHDNQPDHNASPEVPIIIFGDHTCKIQLMVTRFSLGPNVVPFTAKDETPINYLFYLIFNLVETTEYKRYWTELGNKVVAVANSEIKRQFSDFTTSIFQQTEILKQRNRNLRQTRDLLLPKLISGEIDVSELDIDADSI